MSMTHPDYREIADHCVLPEPSYLDEHLRNARGDFLYSDYELPVYGNTVNKECIVDLEPEVHEGYGIAYPQLVPMNDEAGTYYKVTRFEAANAQTDVWVVKDTAWGTQPEGLNTDIARKLMSMGFNVIVKGPEINSSIPLSESAWNTHAILDAYHDLGYLNAKAIAVEGYSRGSMIGFGTAAYAERFDRETIYLNLTDPCVALPIGIDVETLKKGMTLPVDLALLGGAALKGIVKPSRAKNLRGTVDFSIDGLKQFVRTGKPLMSGEAGMMAARTPLDMHATIAFFSYCRVNDAKTFRRILSSRPDVRFVRPAGGHGGGLDEKIIGNMAVRFGRLGAQLHEGRRTDELDYLDIIHGINLSRTRSNAA